VSIRACAFFSPRLDPVLDRGKGHKDPVVRVLTGASCRTSVGNAHTCQSTSLQPPDRSTIDWV